MGNRKWWLKVAPCRTRLNGNEMLQCFTKSVVTFRQNTSSLVASTESVSGCYFCLHRTAISPVCKRDWAEWRLSWDSRRPGLDTGRAVFSRLPLVPGRDPAFTQSWYVFVTCLTGNATGSQTTTRYSDVREQRMGEHSCPLWQWPHGPFPNTRTSFNNPDASQTLYGTKCGQMWYLKIGWLFSKKTPPWLWAVACSPRSPVPGSAGTGGRPWEETKPPFPTPTPSQVIRCLQISEVCWRTASATPERDKSARSQSASAAHTHGSNWTGHRARFNGALDGSAGEVSGCKVLLCSQSPHPAPSHPRLWQDSRPPTCINLETQLGDTSPTSSNCCMQLICHPTYSLQSELNNLSHKNLKETKPQPTLNLKK